MVSAAFFQKHCSYLSELKKTSMIQEFADWLVYGLFGLSADTPIGIAVNFFFYDTIKILIYNPQNEAFRKNKTKRYIS